MVGEIRKSPADAFGDIGQFAVSLYNQDLPDSDLQADFISILDHILEGIPPDAKELGILKQHICPKLIVSRIPGKRWRIEELPTIYGPSTKLLFQWLIRVANEKTSIPERCHASDCNCLFIQTVGGSKQQYCNRTCANREAQRR